MKIITPPNTINANDEEVFKFLVNMNNYKELFPQDKIKNWSSTDDTCFCDVKNMGKIGLKRVASTPNSLIYLDSEKAPFKFTLNLYITKKDNNSCDVNIEFDGEINPFMKMIVEKPLTEFFNKLVFNLTQKYN